MVATANEMLTVPKSDVETREASAVSMMPDDLVKALSDTDVRALVAYLQSPKQVPVLATTDTAKEFFNGKDLPAGSATRNCGRSITARSSARAPASNTINSWSAT